MLRLRSVVGQPIGMWAYLLPAARLTLACCLKWTDCLTHEGRKAEGTALHWYVEMIGPFLESGPSPPSHFAPTLISSIRSSEASGKKLESGLIFLERRGRGLAEYVR